MNLNDVHRGITKNKKRFRVGRGLGSGNGKTAGRGQKGQSSRSGWSMPVTFQGGQNPLIRRIPKRGFTNSFASVIATVNIRDLEREFDAGANIDLAALAEKSLAKWTFDELKVLGDGELTKKFKVSAHRFSKSAIEKIEKAGGEVVVLPGRVPVEDKKAAKRAEKKAKKKK